MNRTAKTGALFTSLLASCLALPAQVFMSEADALKVIAPRAAWKEETRTLDGAARQALTNSTRLRFTEPSYRFQVGREGDHAAAYALTVDEIGKTEPITFTVGLDPAGNVSEVIILVYRESRGGEVRDPRFLKQFRGKTRRDKIQVDRDILNYSGATLSSQALARGVRKALALFEHFYGANAEGAAKAGAPCNHVILSAARQPTGGARDLLLPEQLQMLRPPTGGPSMTIQQSTRYIQARYLMGTICAVEVYSSDRTSAEHAVNAAFAAMQEVDRRMSSFREDSELSMVNRRAAGGNVRVSEELFEVLLLAQRVAEASDGAFDVTVAPLLRVWGFLPARLPPHPSRDAGHPLPEGEGRIHDKNLSPVLPLRFGVASSRGDVAIGYQHVILDSAARSVRFNSPGIEIDLGGIAKGYAVDRGVDALRAAEITSARVSAGGSTTYGLGAPPGDPQGWLLELPSGYTAHLHDRAVSTSGHSEKFVEAGGRRYSHIFDPRRGEPVSTEVATVSVEAASAMESDALTKPFFMLSEREQRRLRRAFPHARVWITRSPAERDAAAR